MSYLFLDQNYFTITNPEELFQMTSSTFYKYYQKKNKNKKQNSVAEEKKDNGKRCKIFLN